jgi:hypothetical protein
MNNKDTGLIWEAYTPGCDFYENIGEYVGAYEPLDLSRYQREVNFYKKWYDGVYRIWSEYYDESYDIALDAVKTNKRLEFSSYGKDHYSTTASLDSLRDIGRYNDVEDSIVARHSGWGLDAIHIIRDGIKKCPENRSFFENVISNFEHQREIIILGPLEVSGDNIVGVWSEKDQDIINI